jgi:hypothetical protein
MNAAEPIVELPIYRRENGLWAHQKSFIKLAFDAHKNGGARYLLADQVGLGKTVQLALAAKLMALFGDKPTPASGIPHQSRPSLESDAAGAA